MPHLIVEYSDTLQQPIQPILHTLHGVLLDSKQFGERDIKVRARAYRDFLVGGAVDSVFVHLTLYLLDGRSEATKAELSQALCAALQAAIITDKRQITVDIRDMVRNTYRKVIE